MQNYQIVFAKRARIPKCKNSTVNKSNSNVI